MEALSEYTGLENCRSCPEYLHNDGKDFLFRLTASKHCSVEKSNGKDTEVIERMLLDWERKIILSFLSF